MATRRAFLKYLCGIGAGFLPWSSWDERLKILNPQLTHPTLVINPSIKQKASSVPGPSAPYLKRTAMEDILALTRSELQGRLAGSVGEEGAAVYLEDQMQGLGLHPLGDSAENSQRLYSYAFTIYPVVEEYKNFYYGRRLSFGSGNPNGLRTPSANIIGALMGTDSHESVILSAHYDHLGIFNGDVYPGANDNASGVGCLLDVMRRLRREGLKPKRSVVLAFWSAEEMGFVGSNSYIQNPTVPLKGIQAVFNADTVGNGALREFALWADGDNQAVQAIKSAAEENKSNAPLTPNHGYNSDQYYFNLAHIPAVTLMARDWLDKNHTPEDIPGFVNPQKVAVASDIIYRAVRKLAF